MAVLMRTLTSMLKHSGNNATRSAHQHYIELHQCQAGVSVSYLLHTRSTVSTISQPSKPRVDMCLPLPSSRAEGCNSRLAKQGRRVQFACKAGKEGAIYLQSREEGCNLVAKGARYRAAGQKGAIHVLQKVPSWHVL